MAWPRRCAGLWRTRAALSLLSVTLHHWLTAWRGRPLSQCLDRLAGNVRDWGRGAPYSDDISLLGFEIPTTDAGRQAPDMRRAASLPADAVTT